MTKPLLILIALCACAPILATSSQTDFQLIVAPTQKTVCLPFTVDLHEAKIREVYSSSVFGLHIDRVVLDGRELQPSGNPAHIAIEDIDVIEIHSRFYTYVVHGGGQIYYSRPAHGQDDGEFETGVFTLPSNWAELKISYRIRFTDGTTSRPYTLCVSRSGSRSK